MARSAYVLSCCLLMSACLGTTTGRVCQPGDDAACGDGAQCLTFCDASDAALQSICAPSFGDPAGATVAEGVIDSRVEFARLANVRTIEGSLRVDATDMQGVALPLLQSISGDLTLIGTALTCFAAPRLTRVGGSVVVDANAHLVKVQLGALGQAGALRVTDNDVLPILSLAAVASLDTTSIVEDNTLLEEVDLQALRTVASGALCVRHGEKDAEPSRQHLPVVSIDALGAGCVEIGDLDAESPCVAPGPGCNSSSSGGPNPCAGCINDGQCRAPTVDERCPP